MHPLIELTEVGLSYDSTPVLEQINLRLQRGQFAALVGPSGAGKTSLLKLLLGMQRPTRGTITVNGQPLADQPAPQIAYVPQLETVDWNFPVTVEQVVLMGRIRRASIWPWPSRADRARMHEVLERLDIGELARKHIRELSGGQQQRVFLARALIAEPELLVLDEPTAGVDLRVADTILHLLAELHQSGMTILMTTHDLTAAAAHVPWAICLNRTLVAQGRPEDVFTTKILNQTYQGDMVVLEHEGMLFIQQKPHSAIAPGRLPQHMPAEHAGPLEQCNGTVGRAISV